MKINHSDGSTTDTDKMSDVDAMLIEKAEEFRKLCKIANRQLFLSVECTKDNGLFWNLTRGESTNEKMQALHVFLNSQLRYISNDVFRLAYKNADGEYVIPPE